MKASLSLYKNGQFSISEKSETLDPLKTSLVLGFGEKDILANENIYQLLKDKYSNAAIVLCSTSGEIYNDTVLDNTVSVSAIEFEKTTVQSVSVNIEDFANSYDAGEALVQQLSMDGLAYIMIISDGAKVNGSELVRGINAVVKNKVPITGGLAGDAARFQSTLVGLNGPAVSGKIVGVGFYGEHFKVSHGSMGGWDMFGPERTITKSIANSVYEIDDKDAIELYKIYLGKYADELPGSALLFPLSVTLPDTDEPVVRTILSIDYDKKAMVFAGDVPVGAKVRFMKANFDKLVDAAAQAGNYEVAMNKELKPKLALLISCVGRKLILDNRVEEEVMAVNEVFGDSTLLTGFYSYGEISPFTQNTQCQLHNQTMTITTFDEN
jgi:hypothetical protein